MGILQPVNVDNQGQENNQRTNQVAQAVQTADQTNQNPVKQGSNFLNDINQLLNQVNELIENPVIKEKIKNFGKGRDQGRAQTQKPQIVTSQDQGPDQEPDQGQPPAQDQGQPPAQGRVNVKDIPIIDFFQAKLSYQEGRKEIKSAIDMLIGLSAEELNGDETTIAEIKEYFEHDILKTIENFQGDKK